MLDPKFIRENKAKVEEGLVKKKDSFDLESFMLLGDMRRNLLHQQELLYAEQNKIDGEMKTLLKDKKDPRQKIEQGRMVKQKIASLDEDFKKKDIEYKNLLLRIPNIPHESVPVGNETKNKIISEEGSKEKFDFKTLTHIELASHLDIVDFKKPAKITGSNFILFKGQGARLERALINFMLDLHTSEHGYLEVSPPFITNRQSMITTGQLPKLEEEMYNIAEDDYFLAPTAEVPITNIHRDETLSEEQLPIYYAAYTPCFRREAGSYGKETRGLARVHQFDKVELVKFVEPKSSYDELEKLLSDASRVLTLLELPFRVNLLATEEISFAAAKCYDIELYAPGVDKWLEVSSCSNFEDFQARRGNIRYKDKEDGKLKFVHTLNGSGVALPRLVIAILENYQQKDGSILIPQVLQKYMGGKERISS